MSKYWFLIILLIIWPSLSSGEPKPEPLCTGSEATLDCLKQNFDILYSTDYEKFCDIYNAAEEKAISGKSIKDVIAFMELAEIDSCNAEFNEAFAEAIEKIFLNKPERFLAALTKASTKSQINIIEDFKTPLIADEDKIKDIFLHYKQQGKFKVFQRASIINGEGKIFLKVSL